MLADTDHPDACTPEPLWLYLPPPPDAPQPLAPLPALPYADRIVPFQDLTGDLPPFLIEDVIHEGTFGVLVGPSGLGKSFVAMSAALSIASGEPFLGKKVPDGSRSPTLYLAGEGTSYLVLRRDAWLLLTLTLRARFWMLTSSRRMST